MPRKSRISAAQRRDWLLRHDKGEPQEAIAQKDKVNRRTVREGIEKARLERDFELAQREQLRDALRGHQRDMLGLVERTQQTIQVPPLELLPWEDVDFGLGSVQTAPGPTQGLIVDLFPLSAAGSEQVPPGVPSHGVRATCDPSGRANEVEFAEEKTRLWRTLREHIGKDPLWNHLGEWKRALLKELQARASFNRMIQGQLEKDLGLPVLMHCEPRPHATRGLVYFTRVQVTRWALGESSGDVAGQLRRRDGRLIYSGLQRELTLTEGLENTELAVSKLTKTIEALTRYDEAQTAAKAHQHLKSRTEIAREHLEGFLLLHHIPGRCSLCKKLGGQ